MTQQLSAAGRRPPQANVSGVRNHRLWACAEHGMIYSAPDDGTAYGNVSSHRLARGNGFGRPEGRWASVRTVVRSERCRGR